jgi:hypothetical protein
MVPPPSAVVEQFYAGGLERFITIEDLRDHFRLVPVS